MKRSLVLLLLIATGLISQSQTYVGIGARIARDSTPTGWWPYISEILEGGGASESDIISHAFIRAIDGVSTTNLSVDKIVQMIVGKEGTTVTLTIAPSGTPQDYVITRHKVINNDLLSLTTPSLIPYRSGKLWGFVNKDKKIIIPLKYTNAQLFTEGLSVVELNGKHGAIDTAGNEVIPYKYTTLYNGKEGLLVYEENRLFGYLDAKGKVIVSAKYKAAYPFSHGLAKVKGDNGYYGFINRQGKEVTPLKYDEVTNFDGHLAAVTLNKQVGFTDVNGKEAVPLTYTLRFNLPALSNGMYPVYNGKLYGYINTSGIEVIACAYTDANSFKNGLAGVEFNDHWIMIDKKGKQLGTGVFGKIHGGMSQGLIANSDPAQRNRFGYTGNYGYSSVSGKLLIPYRFESAHEFINGYAIVNKTMYTYNIITADGEKVSDEVYDEVNQFANGITLLKKGKKWAYAGQGLKTFTPYKFDYAYEFNGGLAWVNFNGGDGYYIDAKGTEYYDPAGELIAKKEDEIFKTKNDVNALNLHPSDGGARLAIDKEYAAYLTKDDEKVQLTKEGTRHMDHYTMSLKNGDRVQLKISTSDFNVVAIIKSPAGKQTVYIQKEKNILNELVIDSIFNESGDYNLFVTSAQVEGTGQYSVYKYIASPKALMVDDKADFCTRLQLLNDHAEMQFAFLLSKITGEDENIFGKIHLWEPTVQLVKDKPAVLRIGGIDHRYIVDIASATTASALEKKFAEYEKQIRSCSPDFEFKLKNDPDAADGEVKALNGVRAYMYKINLMITKDKTGLYVLRLTVE